MIRHSTSSPLTTTTLLLLLLLLPFIPYTTAQTPSLQIVDNSSSYAYSGCWNETSGLAGTNGLRALDGGIHVALPGAMTVELCLDFCARNDSAHGAYALAGLEYSRECWCADALNVLSVRRPDADCDTPCDGANETACGGSLRLSLYNRTGAKGKNDAARGRTEGAWGSVAMGMLVSGLGVVVGIW
ncbi:WSC domain-containing protein [Xylariaceae sp. FL1651]|nr:WSC domain-containing protein [Xylariaceae sp. FL1651]